MKSLRPSPEIPPSVPIRLLSTAATCLLLALALAGLQVAAAEEDALREEEEARAGNPTSNRLGMILEESATEQPATAAISHWH